MHKAGRLLRIRTFRVLGQNLYSETKVESKNLQNTDHPRTKSLLMYNILSNNFVVKT